MLSSIDGLIYEAMSLISLIAALLLHKFRPFADPDPLTQWLQSLADWVERYANAGQRRYGVLAWIVMISIIFVPVTVVYYMLSSVTALLGLLFAIVVLYLAVRFRAVITEFTLIQRALRQDNIDEARERVGKWLNRSTLRLDRTQLAKAAIEYTVLHCYRGLFAVLFWFLVLPGPAGALVYRAAAVLEQRWQSKSDDDEYVFGWFAGRMFKIIDWLPQRLTAISFAIVGDFEDALYCWRSQAQTWGSALEGVVLSASAGALGVRLGDPLTGLDEPLFRPSLGLGEEADPDYMQSAEGLIWRAVVLWALILTLLASVQMIA
jgi:adenosylcobinamide-phosphate synthase